jgi:hypothetical protein
VGVVAECGEGEMLGCGDVWCVRVGGGRGCCFWVMLGVSGLISCEGDRVCIREQSALSGYP